MQIMRSALFLIPVLLIATGCNTDNTERDIIAGELERALSTYLLDAWYPVTLDTVYGGFLSDFTYNWERSGSQDKRTEHAPVDV